MFESGLPGVSFQPGSNPNSQFDRPGRPSGGGFQEAIKVLSLRYPRVVGARAVAPQALLTSPGSGGRPDSVVDRVWQKYFPATAAPSASFPSMDSGPVFTGAIAGSSPAPYTTPQRMPDSVDRGRYPEFPTPPRIVAERPPEWFGIGPSPKYPNMPTWDGGYNPLPSNMTEPAPSLPMQNPLGGPPPSDPMAWSPYEI